MIHPCVSIIYMARLSFVSAYTLYWSRLFDRLLLGDGVDLLCKVINSDIVTGRWCFTVVSTADTNDW